MTVDLVSLATRAENTAILVRDLMATPGQSRVAVGREALRVLLDMELELETVVEQFPGAEVLERMHAALRGYTAYLYDTLTVDNLFEHFERTGKFPGAEE